MSTFTQIFLFSPLLSAITAVASAHALPAFPGAAGFGSSSVGGSGRHLHPPYSKVIAVTTLADSGAGSLRECVDAKVPRVCVFEVGGEIRLLSSLRVRFPYLTIAGQTAPAPGVHLTQAGIRIEASDIIVQHITVRPGGEPGSVSGEDRDAVAIGAAKGSRAERVMLDHLSLSWGVDENFSTWQATTKDVTISHSLIHEGLDHSIHPKGPHSKGALIGDDTQRVTMIGNLFAFHIERNPYLKPGSSVQFFNNFVYGWGPKGGWSLCNLSENTGSGRGAALDFVGNVYIPGPHSAALAPIYAKVASPETRVFVRDNLGPTRSNAAESEWAISSIPEQPTRSSDPLLGSPPADLLQASMVEADVLRNAGSRPAQRNAPDARVIQDIRERKGEIKDCVAGCPKAAGGWPLLVEARHTLKLPDAPYGDSDGDGFTNLEEWLYDQAQAVEVQ
jgi:hypothetical protein